MVLKHQMMLEIDRGSSLTSHDLRTAVTLTVIDSGAAAVRRPKRASSEGLR